MRLKLPDNQMPDDGNMLKRRLLGAAVLIAVAVIALPLLLDGAGSESRFRRVEQLRQEPPRIVDARAGAKDTDKPAATPPEAAAAIAESAAAGKPAGAVPAKPEAIESEPTPVAPAAVAETAPEPVTAAAAVEPATQTAAQTAAQTADQAALKAAAATTAQSGEVVDQVAWVIQAGSYGAQASAVALRDRLRTAGYPSFVSQGRNQGSAVYRVKVGPLNNRQQAARIQSDVESLLGQSTLIRKYPSD